jgi:hypothetical protein
MSLSPVSAIGDMVAPVVLITLATIFSNGLMTIGSATEDRALALDRERLAILGGPHGEMLGEDSVPPRDRERLNQISDQMPVLIRRARRARRAIVIMWAAIGLLMISVAAIAVAVTASSEAFAFTALALVLAGVAGIFVAIATVIAPQARRANAPIETIRNTGLNG